jgi:hypothetical protein
MQVAEGEMVKLLLNSWKWWRDQRKAVIEMEESQPINLWTADEPQELRLTAHPGRTSLRQLRNDTKLIKRRNSQLP